jgi:hypothetical protein
MASSPPTAVGLWRITFSIALRQSAPISALDADVAVTVAAANVAERLYVSIPAAPTSTSSPSPAKAMKVSLPAAIQCIGLRIVACASPGGLAGIGQRIGEIHGQPAIGVAVICEIEAIPAVQNIPAEIAAQEIISGTADLFVTQVRSAQAFDGDVGVSRPIAGADRRIFQACPDGGILLVAEKVCRPGLVPGEIEAVAAIQDIATSGAVEGVVVRISNQDVLEARTNQPLYRDIAVARSLASIGKACRDSRIR